MRGQYESAACHRHTGQVKTAKGRRAVRGALERECRVFTLETSDTSEGREREEQVQCIRAGQMVFGSNIPV